MKTEDDGMKTFAIILVIFAIILVVAMRLSGAVN